MISTAKNVMKISNSTIDPFFSDFLRYQFSIAFDLDTKTLESLKNVTMDRSDLDDNDYVEVSLACKYDFFKDPPVDYC
jgi:hypothetical protein